ncbi:alpha/beta fold hydrolase [Actinomycetospora termitidis]|uniref:Alpha/beta fold hydrolase n=1 Tax=Actinomycetospora termitidis TaxID=3053470 RepID=A0ABT7MBU0_9PSEU|nr:alpha/beta fold hydrolase [Actinomycetospora sp. Odt1-22]MDL5157307.1 alpha/beta fold hydrolase [Actinomycetospora sp. Odt1-22]
MFIVTITVPGSGPQVNGGGASAATGNGSALPFAPTGALGPIGDPTPHWPGRRVRVGDVDLHVRETPAVTTPEGTVVYVHGLGGSATNWTDLAGGLSSRWHGFAVDLPGFGHSEPRADRDYSLRAHAEAVGQFVASLDGPVHLVGNSLGGAVAMTVAAERPADVLTTTLISPAMPDLRPAPARLGDGKMALAAIPLVGARTRRELAAEDPGTRLRRTMRLCYADPDAVSPAAFAQAVAEAAERAEYPWLAEALQRSFGGLVSTWFAPRSRSLWATAARITTPTLVVWGEVDRLISVRKARRTVASIPRARLLRLPGTGHVAQMERPALVARAILGMADAVAGGSWDSVPLRPNACGTVPG